MYKATALFWNVIILCLCTFSLNTEILAGLKVEPADEKLRKQKSNWLRHVTRMNSNRMPKVMLNCRPNGRRRLGRIL